jgi:hypothetical protein
MQTIDPGYWMGLNFTRGIFLNAQHQVSSIQHRPRKSEDLAPTLSNLEINIHTILG